MEYENSSICGQPLSEGLKITNIDRNLSLGCTCAKNAPAIEFGPPPPTPAPLPATASVSLQCNNGSRVDKRCTIHSIRNRLYFDILRSCRSYIRSFFPSMRLTTFPSFLILSLPHAITLCGSTRTLWGSILPPHRRLSQYSLYVCTVTVQQSSSSVYYIIHTCLTTSPTLLSGIIRRRRSHQKVITVLRQKRGKRRGISISHFHFQIISSVSKLTVLEEVVQNSARVCITVHVNQIFVSLKELPMPIS